MQELLQATGVDSGAPERRRSRSNEESLDQAPPKQLLRRVSLTSLGNVAEDGVRVPLSLKGCNAQGIVHGAAKKNSALARDPQDLSKENLIQLAKDSDNDADAKAKLIGVITKNNVQKIRIILALPTKSHARALDSNQCKDLMRVLRKGSFHAHEAFLNRIADDPALKRKLVHNGSLLTGHQKDDTIDRLISVLELED